MKKLEEEDRQPNKDVSMPSKHNKLTSDSSAISMLQKKEKEDFEEKSFTNKEMVCIIFIDIVL